MPVSIMRCFWTLAILLLFLASSGCKKEIDPDYRVPPPLFEPLPITLGVYYGDAFRDARLTNGSSAGLDFVILVGRANISLHDQLLSDMFLETVPLESRFAPPKGATRLDAIIEPEISAFSYDWDVNSGDASVDIIYSYTMSAPDGERLVQWTVRGYGYSREGIGIIGALDNGIQIAMRDAAARFVVTVHEDPAIRRCRERFPVTSDTRWNIQECFAE